MNNNEQFNKYYEAVRYLESLINLSGMKMYAKDLEPGFYLKRVKYLLDLLGNPQEKYKVIHVTGTAGKGSVSDLIQQYLVKNGKRAGLFTSPYSTTSIEKIKVNNKYISPKEFTDLVNEFKPLIDKAYIDCPYGIPSYFEIFFALAAVYFHRKDCEWAVIEVGFGGRLDATNIIKKPEIAIVTNVGYDHVQILGNTLTKIAKEKAAIAKKGSIFITAEPRPHLVKIMEEYSKKVGVKKFVKIKSRNREEDNDRIAKRAIEEIGLNPDYRVSGTMPCRFEVMQKNPTVIMDGAHNEAKIKYFIERLGPIDKERVHCVIALGETKDIDKALSQIANISNNIYVTRYLDVHHKAASLKAMVQKLREYNKNISTQIFLDPLIALEKAIGKANKKDIVLVVGSFYLAGDLRKRWYPEEYVLLNRKSF